MGILGIPTLGVTQRATKSLSGLVSTRSPVRRATPDFDPFSRIRETPHSAIAVLRVSTSIAASTKSLEVGPTVSYAACPDEPGERLLLQTAGKRTTAQEKLAGARLESLVDDKRPARATRACEWALRRTGSRKSSKLVAWCFVHKRLRTIGFILEVGKGIRKRF